MFVVAVHIQCNYTACSPTQAFMPKNNPSQPQVDTPTKNRIVGYANATGNAAEAGQKENIDPWTAQCICKHFKQTGSTAR